MIQIAMYLTQSLTSVQLITNFSFYWLHEWMKSSMAGTEPQKSMHARARLSLRQRNLPFWNHNFEIVTEEETVRRLRMGGPTVEGHALRVSVSSQLIN